MKEEERGKEGRKGEQRNDKENERNGKIKMKERGIIEREVR